MPPVGVEPTRPHGIGFQDRRVYLSATEAPGRFIARESELMQAELTRGSLPNRPTPPRPHNPRQPHPVQRVLYRLPQPTSVAAASSPDYPRYSSGLQSG